MKAGLVIRATKGIWIVGEEVDGKGSVSAKEVVEKSAENHTISGTPIT